MKVESYVFLSKEGKHENISLKVTIHCGVGLFHNGGRDCDSFKLGKYFRSKLLLTVNFWRRPEKLIYIYMYADWMNE